MELKEFITESLSQISEAIADAKKKVKVNDCIINPYIIERFENLNYESEYLGLAKGERIVQAIKFDIAITIEKGSNKGGEISVASSGVSVGFMGSKKQNESTVSRLKFTIPMSFPIEYIE